MGLLIIFEKIPAMTVEQIGLSTSQSLCDWFNKHIQPVDCHVDIELHKGHLQHLVNDLNRLTPDNRKQLFPVRWNETEEQYWQGVNELKTWAEKQLIAFDFNKNKLCFSVSW